MKRVGQSKKGQSLIPATWAGLFIAADLLWSIPLYALSGGETLEAPQGARAAGMGEVHTAISQDLDSLHYNIAGLADLAWPEISSMYTADLFENQNAYLAGALPIKWLGLGTLAVSIFNFSGAPMEINSLDGTTEILQSQNDYLTTLGWAHQITAKLYMGLGLKMFYSTLVEEYSALALAGDIGVLVKDVGNLPSMNVGVTLQNIGDEIKYLDSGDAMPTHFRIGAAYTVVLSGQHSLQMGLDLLLPNDRDPLQNMGLEYNWNQMLFLRGGYKLGYDLDTFTMGAGLRYWGICLDYALANMGWGGNVHRLGLGYAFNVGM